MNCTEFKEVFERFDTFQPMWGDSDRARHEEYIAHLNDCERCGDWWMEQQVRRRGVCLSEHPCVHIAYYTSREPGSDIDPRDDPDVTLVHWPERGEYGIPVRDGGSSVIVIKYCPWCGTRLGLAGEKTA